MGDDVKIKFGGDFTEVPKGADSAMKLAGTAISDSYKKYIDSVKSSIGNMLSVSNIVDKLYTGLRDGLTYFREIDQLSRQLGVSRVDMQKLGKVGVEVGVSMETMAKSLQFANKTIGAATLSAGSQRDTLRALGFTEEEVTQGKVKAVDVMMKLAEQYDKNIDRNIIAKHTVDMFGRAGGELTKVLSEGTTALRERIDAMRVYSDEEVKAAARLDRTIERLEKRAKAVGRTLAATLGRGVDVNTVDNIISAAQKKFGIEEQWFGDTIPEQIAKKPGSLKGMAEMIMKQGAREGYDKADLAELIGDMAEMGGYGSETADLLSSLAGVIRNVATQEDVAKKKKQDEEPGVYAPLVASSLQALGGGDINSVLSGLGSNEVADNTRRTADGVQKLVEKNVDPTPVNDVAK